MIEGVRLLPWVAAQHRLTPSAKTYDCTYCQQTLTREQRQHLRCGWIAGGVRRDSPEATTETAFGDWPQFQTWRGVQGAAIGGRLGPAVCPGYSTQLPIVQECARWWGWESRGVLPMQVETRELVVTPEVLDLADLFASEMGCAEAWELQERSNRR